MAQSTATISGQFRLGFKHDGVTGDNTLTPDQASGNVINFGVSEDLGGGLSAFASSQLRYDAGNGRFNNTSGIANNESGFHLATIGLRSATLGSFQIGRIGFDQLWGYNPWGSTLAAVNPSRTAGATENGQFRYTSPNLWGFTAVVGGSMKDNNRRVTDATTFPATTVPANTYGRQYMLNYANGPFAATVLAERIAVASTPGGNKYRGLGASYDFGFLKLMGIVAREETAAEVDVVDGYSISAAAPVAGFVFKAGWMNDELAANRDKTALGIEYALSKRTVLELTGYKFRGDNSPTYWLGARHTF